MRPHPQTSTAHTALAPLTMAVIGLTLAILALARPAAAQADPDILRAHTEVLAHDLLEGRGTAGRGERLAAVYITATLRRLGLSPLPGQPDDFRIPIDLVAFELDDGATSLRITAGDRQRTLRPPDFYHPGGGPASFRDFAGELVVAGPAPGALDVLADFPDLSGRVVVIGPPWSGLEDVMAGAAHRGAAGVVQGVPTPFYDRLRVVRGPVRFALEDADDPGDALPLVVVGPAGIDALGLADAIRPPGDDAAGSTASTGPTGTLIDVDFAFSAEPRTGYNVAAMLPGSDPQLADEYVVVMAHYDHVGFGQPDAGDSIWNGFADNAAGVAVTLEVARALAVDPPARSTIFLLTTAEEQGLLGATAFADNAVVPLDRIAAVINIDGGAPPADIRAWTVAAPVDAPLGDLAAAAIRHAGHHVRRRPIIADSDHWAFHRHGVPALFLYPNQQGPGGGAHTPHDEWRPDFPFDGLARYADTALAVIRAAAASDF